MNARTERLIKDITDYQISLVVPKKFSWHDRDNHIRNMEKSFEKACNSLEELGVNNPHGLTTFQFYSKIRYFKEKKDTVSRPKTPRR